MLLLVVLVVMVVVVMMVMMVVVIGVVRSEPVHVHSRTAVGSVNLGTISISIALTLAAFEEFLLLLVLFVLRVRACKHHRNQDNTNESGALGIHLLSLVEVNQAIL